MVKVLSNVSFACDGGKGKYMEIFAHPKILNKYIFPWTFVSNLTHIRIKYEPSSDQASTF